MNSNLMNPKIYEIYKPLRNHLGKIGIENAYYVIWAYINFFQFDSYSFPLDIEVHESVINGRNIPNRGVLEWELSLLAREVTKNGQDSFAVASTDFREWRHFSNAVTKIKNFENESWPIYGNASTIYKELRRIAHRQFPWQTKPSKSLFIRYFKIYNNPRIKEIIAEILGLSVQNWYIIGSTIFGALLSNPKFNVDTKISVGDITKKEFDAFLSYTSTSLEELKNIIQRDVHYDDEFVYTFNPLEYYPLIKIGSYYYCPVVNFLVWRITSGIFFDLINNKKFGHPFGFAFQDYLEEVARKILNPKLTKIIPEAKYTVSGNEEDSVDLILSQPAAAIFVEAKAKRMKSKAKSELLSEEIINKELRILSQDIGQVYATIHDYLLGKYVHFPNNKKLKISPLLITLEDWFMMGDDSVTLMDMVKQELGKRNLPETYVNEMPYTVCSAEDFEILVQVLNTNSIEEIMSKWNPLNKQGHNFGNFLRTEFKGTYKSIEDYFPEDFDKIYKNLLN